MPRGRRNSKALQLVDSRTVLDERTSILAKRAYQLRTSGCTLDEVAEQLELPRGSVAGLIRNSMREASDLVSEGAKSELLLLEVSRLDALQRAVWPAAMNGDTRSVDTALKVIAQRAKLLGLEHAVIENTNNTVVVAGDSAAYIAALRQAADSAFEEMQ